MKTTKPSLSTCQAPRAAPSACPVRTTVTITDDDPTPALTVSDASVMEGNSGSATLVFTVTLWAVSGRPVTVNYATNPNTATAGVDYTSTNGTLTFAPGVTSQTVSVSVIPDTIDEPDESVLLDLTATPSTPHSPMRRGAASSRTTIRRGRRPPRTSTAMAGRIWCGVGW